MRQHILRAGLFFVLSLVTAILACTYLTASAAAPKAEGGSTQVSAQDGCMNQWMFNGVWRVRVTNVAFHPKDDGPNGWDVTMQWANGTSYAGISPVDTMKQSMVLAMQNGDTITASGDSIRASLNEQKLDYHTFPASGQFTYTQMFLSGDTLDENNKPAKLLITFDVPKYKAAHPGNSGKFWKMKTAGYNYRINLNCTK
jgi:hypothetical protein